jgi:hypothetical protein
MDPIFEMAMMLFCILLLYVDKNFLVFEGLKFSHLEVGFLEIKWHFEHMTLSMFGLCTCNKISEAWVFHIQCWIMWYIL